MELEKLAKWVYNNWNDRALEECFIDANMDKYERKYFKNKFNSDLLLFFLSLDAKNRIKFEEYLKDKLKNYK